MHGTQRSRNQVKQNLKKVRKKLVQGKQQKLQKSKTNLLQLKTTYFYIFVQVYYKRPDYMLRIINKVWTLLLTCFLIVF